MSYVENDARFASRPSRPEHRLSKVTIVAMAAVALVLALIGLDEGLMSTLHSPVPRPVYNVVRMSGATPVQSVVYMSVSPGIKPGPGGQLYDAFSVTNFTVRAGQPVKLVVNNTDDTVHSITSPEAGVNIILKPGTHTYTLLVRHTGHFEWHCAMKCDPFSMSHVGYMRGYINAV